MKIDESMSVAESPSLLSASRILRPDRVPATAARQPLPAQADYSALAPNGSVVGVKAGVRRFSLGRIVAGAVILAAAAAGIGGYAYHAAGFETTDDAFLEGDVHPVSPRIDGTVARVLVDDNAHVEAGQPLVEIDPADLNLAVQGGEADLAQARAGEDQVTAQIAKAQADVEAATARIAQNAAQLNRAELDFNRMETLVSQDAVSRQEFDAARATFDSAKAAQQSLLSERAADDAGLAAARAQRAVALAQVQKAEAALGTARLQVDYTVIRAPSSGRIAKKSVEVGQRLQPGQPVMAVVDDRVWVVANFKENQLAHLRAGESVKVEVDAAQGRVFQGVVESFSPGTGAKFSLLPPDNSTGNFTKIVQRVPVKILFDDPSVAASAARLTPGLSAIVRVSIRP
jgi:membrane fusion protein (multidrug efflux system)